MLVSVVQFLKIPTDSSAALDQIMGLSFGHLKTSQHSHLKALTISLMIISYEFLLLIWPNITNRNTNRL